MEENNARIAQIKQEIKSLVSRYSKLRQEHGALLEKNAELARLLTERDKKIEDIQNKNINLQLSRALGKSGTGETDLKHRLDEYILEIEAAIAHLKD